MAYMLIKSTQLYCKLNEIISKTRLNYAYLEQLVSLLEKNVEFVIYMNSIYYNILNVYFKATKSVNVFRDLGVCRKRVFVILRILIT